MGCSRLVVTKRKGFSSVLALSKKKTNQHRTLHLDSQRIGLWSIPMEFYHGSAPLCEYKMHTYYKINS